MPDLPHEVAGGRTAAFRRRRVTLALAVATGLAACGSPPSGKAVRKEKVRTLWPEPPEQPRFEYQATLRSPADVVRETREMQLEKTLTGRGLSQLPVIDKPTGMASRSGLVYLAEPSMKSVTVFDVPRRKLFSFGLRPPHQLRRPMAIALDASQRVYVLDAGLRKVMVFDRLGLFDYAVALEGFSRPVAVAASPDGATIVVVDRGEVDNEDHKVVAFGRDGKERFRLGPRGSEPGRFNIPLAAATGADGALYVVDSGNFRVQKFDAQGRFLFAFGGPGAELGRFSRPRAIALDGDGNIYVADGGFGNVQIFDPQGRLLMPLGRLSPEPGPGNFQLIAGIAVDETGRLYVLDHFDRRVEVFLRLSDREAQRRLAARQ